MSKESLDKVSKNYINPRVHPAIRSIARACIALARWQREQTAAKDTTSEQATSPRAQVTKSNEEARDD